MLPLLRPIVGGDNSSRRRLKAARRTISKIDIFLHTENILKVIFYARLAIQFYQFEQTTFM
jgi:hypothetical protein